MGIKPTHWALHPRYYHALNVGCCIGIWLDEMHISHTLSSTLGAILYILDAGPLDDDVMVGFDGDVGVFYH